MAIRGIYGRPFVPMDHLLDIPGLLAIHDDIVDGLSKSNRSFGNYGPGVLEPDKYLDTFVLEESINKMPEDHPEKVRFKQFKTRDDRRTYLKLVYGAYSGFRTVNLRGTKNPHGWWTASECTDTKDAANFPSFMKWVSEQKIFAGVGRINFFVTDHDMLTVEHRDRIDGRPHIDEMIWVRTVLDKSLYVLDPATREKYYIEGHAAFFNHKDYHGGDRPSRMMFSFRVDGKFTVETRRAIGVPDDPRY